MKIYLHRNGRTYGPYPEGSIKGFLESGLIGENDLAFRSGMKEWSRLGDLLDSGEGDVRIVTEDQLEWKWIGGRDGFEIAYYEGRLFTGRYDGFYEGGQKMFESNYKDGKKDGLFTTWNENGQKSCESNWKDGKMEGLETMWYENGQKMNEGNYKDGKENGLWINYDDDGTEESRETYKDGLLVNYCD